MVWTAAARALEPRPSPRRGIDSIDLTRDAGSCLAKRGMLRVRLVGRVRPDGCPGGSCV
jgi:hypothetical protein